MGYWAIEVETGQEGLVQELDDVFWTHDEVSDARISRHFKGRMLVKKDPAREQIKRRSIHQRCSFSFQPCVPRANTSKV